MKNFKAAVFCANIEESAVFFDLTVMAAKAEEPYEFKVAIVCNGGTVALL
nr:hypothetical protein [uncultured Caproiciproducens sp.]